MAVNQKILSLISYDSYYENPTDFPRNGIIAQPLATNIKTREMKFLILLCVMSMVSCSSQREFDKDKETKAIMELHNMQRDYHFNKDSISFANQLSENFISVNKGSISRPKKSETITRYHSYFSSVEFIKWDDVSKPIIEFSDDGTLAYCIVDKIVKVAYKDTTGETIEGETHFVWTAIYKKYGNEWKIDCVTSTEQPNDTEKLKTSG